MYISPLIFALDEDEKEAKEWAAKIVSEAVEGERERILENLSDMPWPKGFPKTGEFCLADGYNLAFREFRNIIINPQLKG